MLALFSLSGAPPAGPQKNNSFLRPSSHRACVQFIGLGLGLGLELGLELGLDLGCVK